MSDENDKKWFEKKISRRDFLKKAGIKEDTTQITF